MKRTKSKKQQTIIIYGEKWCPFCTNAKSIAKKMTKKFKFISGKSSLELKRILKLRKIPETIPQIVVDGKHIGGFTNLQKQFLKKIK